MFLELVLSAVLTLIKGQEKHAMVYTCCTDHCSSMPLMVYLYMHRMTMLKDQAHDIETLLQAQCPRTITF